MEVFKVFRYTYSAPKDICVSNVYKYFASLHVHVNCDMFYLEGRGVREISDCFLSLLDSTELNLALRGCPVAIAETAAAISVSVRLCSNAFIVCYDEHIQSWYRLVVFFTFLVP